MGACQSKSGVAPNENLTAVHPEAAKADPAAPEGNGGAGLGQTDGGSGGVKGKIPVSPASVVPAHQNEVESKKRYAIRNKDGHLHSPPGCEGW
jgi:hypothetical protein